MMEKMLLLLATVLFFSHAGKCDVLDAALIFFEQNDTENSENPKEFKIKEFDITWKSTQNRLVHDILKSYDKKVKPTRRANEPVIVSFSMELYQIIEVNEPQQFVLINAWIIERWRDELLYWDPDEFEDINEIMLPHDIIWLPDTTLYNTLIMKSEDERRLMNAKLVTNTTDQSVYVELLYPTIYKFSCLLNVYYFPFDSQICRMTFGSWTYDKTGIDYVPYSENVGTSNFLENVGWSLRGFKAIRQEHKYACCPYNYTNLYYTLHIKRKPLYYMANLIIPTCIITLISIVGFFTPSSASGERDEKISLGITTLLSMSILLLMISDQMPTTSTFVPLIGWFFLSMIILISMGAIMSSVIISVQKMGLKSERLSPRIIRTASWLSRLSFTRIPNHLHHDKRVKTKSRVFLLKQGPSTGTSLVQHSESVAPLLISPLFDIDKHNDDTPNSFGSDENTMNSSKSCAMKQRKASEVAVYENFLPMWVSQEYEWLATVMERWSFFFFFILFLLLSVGINAIGLVHWMRS